MHKSKFGVGASLLRKEDARHLRGHGQFVSDLRLADTQEVAFVRSPHAHARIRDVAVPRGHARTHLCRPRSAAACRDAGDAAGDRLQGLGLSAAGAGKGQLCRRVHRGLPRPHAGRCGGPRRLRARRFRAAACRGRCGARARQKCKPRCTRIGATISSSSAYLRTAISRRRRAPPRSWCGGPIA